MKEYFLTENGIVDDLAENDIEANLANIYKETWTHNNKSDIVISGTRSTIKIKLRSNKISFWFGIGSDDPEMERLGNQLSERYRELLAELFSLSYNSDEDDIMSVLKQHYRAILPIFRWDRIIDNYIKSELLNLDEMLAGGIIPNKKSE